MLWDSIIPLLVRMFHNIWMLLCPLIWNNNNSYFSLVEVNLSCRHQTTGNYIENGYWDQRETCGGSGDSPCAIVRSKFLVRLATASSLSHPFCPLSGIKKYTAQVSLPVICRSFWLSLLFHSQNAFEITYFFWVWVSSHISFLSFNVDFWLLSYYMKENWKGDCCFFLGWWCWWCSTSSDYILASIVTWCSCLWGSQLGIHSLFWICINQC